MFSVGSAIRVQKEKEKAETKMSEFGRICNEAKKEAKARRDNDIRDLYDRRPNMLLSELAQIVGVSVPELKEILMGSNL